MSVPDPASEDSADNKTCSIKLHIWDTGGQEQFRSMLNMYYRDADAALICYDVANEQTFKSVFYWIGEMEKNCNNDRSNFVLAMAGNKCDLDDNLKQVSLSQADEAAKENNMIFQETSARTGEGVQELFMTMIK